MAKLNPNDLRKVWADYMSDASARNAHIPYLKLELLAEMEKLDVALDKGDPLPSTALAPAEVTRLSAKIQKARLKEPPPPPQLFPDATDILEGTDG